MLKIKELIKLKAYTIVYNINTGPTKVITNSTYQIWVAKNLSISHLKTFGLVCCVHILVVKRKTLDRNRKNISLLESQ